MILPRKAVFYCFHVTLDIQRDLNGPLKAFHFIQQKTRPKQVVFTTWSNTNRSNLIPFRLVQDPADLWVSEDLVYLVRGKANELVAEVVDPSLV